MSISNPFHDGELAVQERAGQRDTAILNSRMIADAIMPQALAFIENQPWAILGGPDAQGRLWCSTLLGEPGFMEPSRDGREIRFDLQKAPVHPADPLLGSLTSGQALGALFIELATRRRLRANGHVGGIAPDQLLLSVNESFPNCPRFIQPRAFEGSAPPSDLPALPRSGQSLGQAEKALIQQADTFFLASLHPERGVDASHRGGKPGFMEVIGDSLLRVPDYPGNGLFQTFGNLAVDARSGWVVPDFATGGQLQLSGQARVVWDDPDPLARTAGTHRFLELDVTRWCWTPPAHGAPRWTFMDYSPLNP